MVGWLDGLVFRKIVSAKKHLFEKSNSWGIDANILKQLPENGQIRIKDIDDGVIYVISVEDFKNYGQYLHFQNDIDYHVQVFVWRSFFDSIRNDIYTTSEEREQNKAALKWFDEYPCFCDKCERERIHGEQPSHSKT